jgi:hypothetical protein
MATKGKYISGDEILFKDLSDAVKAFNKAHPAEKTNQNAQILLGIKHRTEKLKARTKNV